MQPAPVGPGLRPPDRTGCASATKGKPHPGGGEAGDSLSIDATPAVACDYKLPDTTLALLAEMIVDLAAKGDETEAA